LKTRHWAASLQCQQDLGVIFLQSLSGGVTLLGLYGLGCLIRMRRDQNGPHLGHFHSFSSLIA